MVKKEKYLADNELKFNETLSSVISVNTFFFNDNISCYILQEKDKLSTELTQLREKCEDFAKSVKDLKGQLDQSKRQTEELLIERKHIDQQVKFLFRICDKQCK